MKTFLLSLSVFCASIVSTTSQAQDLPSLNELTPFVNLGKELWSVVVNNQGAATIERDYANALPEGISDPLDLENFSDLQFHSYRLYGKNRFGSTVYDITYTLVHQYGGSWQGKGQYLSTVSVIPTHVEVAWGYKVNLDVRTVSIVNVGTKDEPIPSVNLEVKLRVQSPVKNSEGTTLFQIRGDRAEVLASPLGT